jgi:hypothetical protein
VAGQTGQNCNRVSAGAVDDVVITVECFSNTQERMAADQNNESHDHEMYMLSDALAFFSKHRLRTNTVHNRLDLVLDDIAFSSDGVAAYNCESLCSTDACSWQQLCYRAFTSSYTYSQPQRPVNLFQARLSADCFVQMRSHALSLQLLLIHTVTIVFTTLDCCTPNGVVGRLDAYVHDDPSNRTRQSIRTMAGAG